MSARHTGFDRIPCTVLDLFQASHAFEGNGTHPTRAAQRVSLATALVNDPHLLLLDDPFARLDPIMRAAIQSELVPLWRRAGFTELLATSDMNEAASVASRAIVRSAQSARIMLDLTLEREFPRHPADPCRVRARRELLQSLDGVGTSQSTGPLGPRHTEPSERPGNLAMTTWPGDEPASRHTGALA